MEKLFADTLDLINRKDAEIERLERDVFTYKIRWAKAESRETKAKAEAYKEFAEELCDEWLAVVLLKNKSDDYGEGYHDALCFVEERIDNLLKEKVGAKYNG